MLYLSARNPALVAGFLLLAMLDRFEIRAFHVVVIGRAAMPLQALEGQVEAWIEEESAQ